MIYNQHNLNVSKIASKSESQPELSGVFITRNFTVATDRYRLLEVTAPKDQVKDFPQVLGRTAMHGMKPVIVNAEALRKVKPPVKFRLPILENIAISHRDDQRVDFIKGIGDDAAICSVPVIDGQYPDYQKIFPVGKPQAEVVVNAKLLSELLDIMSKLNEQIKIKIYGTEKPILIEGETPKQKARGLIMPIKNT